MLKQMGKKIFTILCSKICLSKPINLVHIGSFQYITHISAVMVYSLVHQSKIYVVGTQKNCFDEFL